MTASTVCRFTLWLLLSGVASKAWPQASTPLPLKTHKFWHARKVLLEALPKNDSLGVAEACYLFGKAYIAAADYRTAQFWLVKALRIHEQLGESEALTKVYLRLVEIESWLGRWPKALQYARQALEVAKRIRSSKATMQAYNALAHVFEDIPANSRTALQTDSIWLYYQFAGQLASTLHDTLSIAYHQSQMGRLLLARNNRQGLGLLQRSLTTYTRSNLWFDQLRTSLLLAEGWLGLGQPKQAKPYIDRAKQIYTKQNMSDYSSRLHIEAVFLNYYQAMNDWKGAFNQLERVRTLEQSQYSADRDGAVTRLSVEYETEKKEALLKAQKQELALQTENQRVQNWFLWAVSALLLVAGGMSVVFYRLSRKNKRISLQNAELVREQNHRVKNNLQTMSNLLTLQANRLTDVAAKKAVAESQLRIETMAVLQRQLYDGNQLARVDLAEFIPELVGMVLQAFGYEAIEPDYSLSPTNVSADQAMPVALILSELTTNACKYAFPDHPNPLFRVSCQQRGNQIIVAVADNGPGLHPLIEQDVMVKTRTSFGMKLIQTQVDQLRGTGQFSTDEGTQFTLSFTT
ncbi:MAG: sensor histidine kinase [Cytophagales bacterium]|nr:MAG: sensor histidine kinase [Cytophagales bacterium]